MPRALCGITFSVCHPISETQKIGSGRLSKFMEPQFRSFSVSSLLLYMRAVTITRQLYRKPASEMILYGSYSYFFQRSQMYRVSSEILFTNAALNNGYRFQKTKLFIFGGSV